MQAAADLDLPYLAMDQDWFARDPFPHFAEARARHPWLARSPFGLVINDYTAIRDFFRMEEKLANPYDDLLELMGAKGTAWGRFQESHMLAASGAAHKRLRDVLAPAFTPRMANLHRGLMREVIARLLDEWAPKRAFDFEEFASYFPITVMCRLLGASPDVIPELRSSLEALGLSTAMDPKLLPRLDEATNVADAFCHRFMADRRAGKRLSEEADLLDMLLEAQASGGLSDRELADILIFLFVAGYDTSKNILTLIMHELVGRPEVHARCAEDIDYCRKVTDETFRYHSTAAAMRVVGEEFVYRDVKLEKGAMVWFPINVIGRDPRTCADPDRFDPDRPREFSPIPFSLGVHICLGQYIARAQIEEGLHLMTQRRVNLRSPGPEGWRPFGGVWGIRGLPIEFDVAG
jgi:cytochrome P450